MTVFWHHALAQGPLPPIDRLGGKGMGLARLVRAGAEVPPFFVVPPGTDDDVAVAAYQAAGWPRVAVRSSAVGEDGARHSFAGLYESVLDVRDETQLRAALARCRESADADRVAAYLDTHGLPPTPVAVVVQEMVHGAVSGVMFTVDPGDPDVALVSGTWGLGEGVVQGSVPADTWRVPLHNGRDGVSAQIAHKDQSVRPARGGADTVHIDVPVGDRDRPSLSAMQVRALVDAGRKAQTALGMPLDIEWTFRDEASVRPILLQARPITVAVPQGRRLLWDNANIIESYHGPTGPLTYSFASRAYTIVYQLFCEVMGVEAQVIRAHSGVFPRMIGLVRGRIYYNLNAWYTVVSLLPGYRWNRQFLEQMMGVSEVASDADAGAAPSRGDRLRELPRMVRMAGGLMWRIAWVERDIRKFKQTFEDAVGRYRGPGRELTRANLDPHALLDVYTHLESQLLWAWSVPIVNDFFVMIFHGLLKSLCEKWIDGPDELHNALLAGQGDVYSVQPTADAMALAGRITRSPGARALFDAQPDDALLLDALPAHAEVARAFDAWIDKWGDRCSHELKLEVETVRQQPTQLVAMLRGLLASDATDPARLGGGDQRQKAELVVQGRLTGWRRSVFDWVLGQARRRVAAREELRFMRTRIFGLVRDIFRELGGHMVAAGSLDGRDDVFWLTVDEALGWVRGTTVTTDLRALAALRRDEYAGFAEAPMPADRFHTWGPIWAANTFMGKPPAALTGDPDVLIGQSACPGKVRAPAAVVLDPQERAAEGLQGAVLVTYRTDPGWVPLFPGASAIVVERGSLLSHSAVVARELGIPCVVAVRGLMERVEDGQLLEVDATVGTVRLVAEEPDP